MGGPDGRIYFVPYRADNIGVYDPSTGPQSFTVIDIKSIISVDEKYSGGVLGPNGLIYFVPYSADNIGVLDPSTQSFTVIDIASTISGKVVSEASKYTGGCSVLTAASTSCRPRPRTLGCWSPATRSQHTRLLAACQGHGALCYRRTSTS